MWSQGVFMESMGWAWRLSRGRDWRKLSCGGGKSWDLWIWCCVKNSTLGWLVRCNYCTLDWGYWLFIFNLGYADWKWLVWMLLSIYSRLMFSFSLDEFYGLFLCVCVGWFVWVQVGNWGEWVWDCKVQSLNGTWLIVFYQVLCVNRRWLGGQLLFDIELLVVEV